MEAQILKLEQELAQLKAEFYKENYPASQVIRKDLALYGKIGFFGVTPSSQGASVATVAVPSGTYQQTEANNAVTAINAIIARLQAYGLLP